MSSHASHEMPTDIADYFSAQTPDARERLGVLRTAIKQSAPSADELISFKMPAFTYPGMLVWYGAFTSHIGFYPGSACIKAFRDELADYEVAKGTVRFPYDRPLPVDIVTKIVTFKMDENLRRAKAKQRH